MQRRLCYVQGEKYLFHQWFERAFVEPPSMMIGGSPGGQFRETFGLVEHLETGQMREVFPIDVRFETSPSKIAATSCMGLREALKAGMEEMESS